MKKTAMMFSALCMTLATAAPSFAGIFNNTNGGGGYCKVPEPSTLLMLGGALAGMALLRNRLRKG